MTLLRYTPTARLLTSAATVVLAVAVVLGTVAPAAAAVVESWESQGLTDPFTGSGDRTWTGDVNDWAITSATWATGEPFVGNRSLRSSNVPASTPSTIVTDVTAVTDLAKGYDWSIFVSGNDLDFGGNRRLDLILLSDTGNTAALKSPSNNVRAYKLTLWDPLSNPAADFPANSHEAALLGESLTLWSVDNDDDRWRVIASTDVPLAQQDFDLGFNVNASRAADGTWSFGYSTGPAGTPVTVFTTALPTAAENDVAFTGASSFYTGIGWTARGTFDDNTDLGVDQLAIGIIPEPGTALLLLPTTLLLIRRRTA